MAGLAPGIDRHQDKQGGEPCVAGTRVPVRRIGDLVEREGVASDEAAGRYDITLSDVYRALAYYHDHPAEMQEFAKREREAERSTDATESFAAARDRLGAS